MARPLWSMAVRSLFSVAVIPTPRGKRIMITQLDSIAGGQGRLAHSGGSKIHSACERACRTISTNTFRVSAGLLTSLKKAMRAPRMPSGVLKRT